MNNYPKFDPMTGQPLQPNVQPVVPNMVQPKVQNVPTNVMEPVQPVIEHQPQIIQQPPSAVPEVQVNTTHVQLENIPTVEQGKQEFINNTQAMNIEKKEEKKEGVNFWFVLIMFGVILAAIFFLFPLLLNYV